MTTTPELDAAREALTAAEAEVDRLRSQLRGALADQESRGHSAADDDKPKRLGWEDGVAEARRRHGEGKAAATSTKAATEDHTDEPERERDTTAKAGREEARRRAAARGSAV